MLRSLERDDAIEQMSKTFGAKKSRPAGRWKRLLILLAVLLLIPALQVAMICFLNPPRTLPMLLEQSGALISRQAHAPLRYQMDRPGADTGIVPEASLDFGGSTVLPARRI